MNVKTSEPPADENSPDNPAEAARRRQQRTRPMRLAERHKANAGIIEELRSSKETARDKDAGAVKEIEAIDAEIEKLNGDLNGIYGAAKSLLQKSKYHGFPNVRFSEQGGAYRGKILGVAEYNGYAVVLQDGPTERFETGRRDIFGRPETSSAHTVWAHEIRLEQTPEMENFVGHTATISTDDEGDIMLSDIYTQEEERERSHGKGFSR
jgi:hypothetical protein